jgi:uncharacterized protein (TIGR02145 family)
MVKKSIVIKKTVLIYQVIVSVFILFLATDCKKDEPAKDEPAKLAVLSTTPVTNFSTITAASGGNITSNGGAEILSNGVCWSTSINPTITDSKTVDALGIAQFVSSVSGLIPATTYHVRAYATNSVGTAYGEDVTFTTLSSTTVADAEGNFYNIITIGVQVWMAENLKATRYRNGDLIGTTTPATLDITAEDKPKYQWASYGNEVNVAAYGRLYTWYAATDSRNVCPSGWHLPTQAEWTTLDNYLGDLENSGHKLREADTTHWTYYITETIKRPYLGGTNETGFTALPSGFRDGSGYFEQIGHVDEWWSSTEFSTGIIYFWELYIDNFESNRWFGSWGYSVRCLRD